jgi:hypothetical protein
MLVNAKILPQVEVVIEIPRGKILVSNLEL